MSRPRGAAPVLFALLTASACAILLVTSQLEWRSYDSSLLNTASLLTGLNIANIALAHLALVSIALLTGRQVLTDVRSMTVFESLLIAGGLVPIAVGLNIVTLFLFFIVSIPFGIASIPIAFAINSRATAETSSDSTESRPDGDEE